MPNNEVLRESVREASKEDGDSYFGYQQLLQRNKWIILSFPFSRQFVIEVPISSSKCKFHWMCLWQI